MTVDRAVSAAQLSRLLLDWRTGRPAYVALATRVRLLVRDGRLPTRTRLPAERELALALGASRTTVGAAYDLLRQEGYLQSRQGSGTWIRPPASTADVIDRQPLGRPYGDDVPELIDLVQACPSAPAALMTAVDAAVQDLRGHLHSTGYQPLGLRLLRDQIAEDYAHRGLPTTGDQILITSGAAHAFALVLGLLTGPGDRVLVETPTYPNALAAASRSATRPVPVAMTEQGWDLDMVEATLRQAAPRLAYLMPDFHNPTGQLLDDAGRIRLAGLLRATRTVAVADETCALLGLDGTAAPPPLAAYHPSVLTAGSMSKSYWGGLRVGWLRADPETVHRLAAVRATGDLAGPVLDQLVAAHLLARADEVLPERRAVLRDRRDALADALRRELPDWTFRLPAGGLSLWLDLGEPISSALTVAAERHGLALAAGPRFGADAAGAALDRRIRIPFSHPEPVLLEAVRRLVDAAADVRFAPAGRMPAGAPI